MLDTGCSQNNNAVCLQLYLFILVSGKAVLCLSGMRLKEHCGTADQVFFFPWLLKEKEKKKQTNSNCIMTMASNITFCQQYLAQIDKAAASIWRFSWYRLCQGNFFQHFSQNMSGKQNHSLIHPRLCFPLRKKHYKSCMPVGQVKRQLSLYFFLYLFHFSPL